MRANKLMVNHYGYKCDRCGKKHLLLVRYQWTTDAYTPWAESWESYYCIPHEIAHYVRELLRKLVPNWNRMMWKMGVSTILSDLRKNGVKAAWEQFKWWMRYAKKLRDKRAMKASV